MGIWSAALAMLGLGLAFGIGLAICSRVLAVKTDPRVEMILDVLPQVNCGACGYAGCGAYAEAVAGGDISCGLCAPGGADVAEGVAGIMGVQAQAVDHRVSVLMCQGGTKVADRYEYDGIEDCRAAQLVAGGGKECDYGCLGLGTCARVCPVDAIRMSDEGLPVVLEDRCIACGKCVDECPRGLFLVLPMAKTVHVACMSHDKGARAKKLCPRACTGCRKCEKACQYDAIHVLDNVASIDYDKCVACGECVEVCPTGAIVDLGPIRKPTNEEVADPAGV